MHLNDTAPIGAIAELCLAYDMLDEANGERIGGSLESANRTLSFIEGQILASPSAEPTVIAWKMRLLARALENEWADEHTEAVAASIIGKSAAQTVQPQS